MNESRAELLLLMAQDGATVEDTWATLYLARCLFTGRHKHSPSRAQIDAVHAKLDQILEAEQEPPTSTVRQP